jgi:hypothetical protein
MAQHWGPHIIADGLVVAMDAADKVSYPDSLDATWINLVNNGSDNLTLSGGYSFNSANGGYHTLNGSTSGMGKINATLSFKDTNEGTIAAWVKYTSTDGYIGAFQNQANRWLSVRPGSTYMGIYDYYPNGSRAIGSASTTAINNGVWHYIVRAKTNGSTADKLYADGIPQSYSINDGAIADQWFTDYSAPDLEFLIGPRWANGSYGGFWTGSIAALHLYNRPLSASEVIHNFNAQRGRFGV